MHSSLGRFWGAWKCNILVITQALMGDIRNDVATTFSDVTIKMASVVWGLSMEIQW